MVKLNKIYTRTGDDGSTGLGDGSRVAKADPRVEAYGTTDEANAALGLAIIACRDAGGSVEGLATVLESLQHDLFDCGADLCTPVKSDGKEGERLRVIEHQVDRLEELIDHYNEGLQPLTSFVLPGGTRAAAALHLARTIVRRAERLSSQVLEAEPDETNPIVIRYLNRLSDLLFVLGRVANTSGDVLWKPGANRDTDHPHT